MAASLFPSAQSQFFDNNGDPLSLGTVEITYSLTAEPAPTYTDSIKSTLNEDIIQLSASGKADIYLDYGSFDIVTRNSLGEIEQTTNNYVIEEITIPEAPPPTAGGVPVGGIVMWNGLIANIPTDWQICDGTNGTPDLQDKFVLGTTLQGEIGDTGGSSDAVLVSHTHTIGHTHTANHNHSADASGKFVTHLFTQFRTGLSGGDTSGGTYRFTGDGVAGDGQTGWGIRQYDGYAGVSIDTADVTTSDSSITDSGSTGESGVNTNLPPYYKLAYIQRMT